MDLKGKDESAVRLWLLQEGFKETVADCFESTLHLVLVLV